MFCQKTHSFKKRKIFDKTRKNVLFINQEEPFTEELKKEKKDEEINHKINCIIKIKFELI